jgi:branched-chain amino acid transport system substrate-binding protein
MNQRKASQMKQRTRRIVLAAIAVLIAAVAAGCGSSSSSSSTTSSSTAAATSSSSTTASASSGSSAGAASLGTPHKATGTPYLFGVINLLSGPVTFPEVTQAEQAGVDYVNNYLNGINGHPIQLDICASDGQPATSQSCANQIAAKNPLMILGAADTGAPGAFPVYERKGYAYIGGVPFTPVESNAPNAAIFISLTVADNGAAIEYAKTQYHVTKAAVIYTDDTQGTYTGNIIKNEMKNAGMTVTSVPVSPTQADMSSAAASAISSSPQLVYIETPSTCPAVLKALQSVGYTGHIGGIDPCTSPPALAAAGSAANGLLFAEPFYSLNAGNADANLAGAILAKYAPKNIAVDSPALAGLGSVINIQRTLSKMTGPLNGKTILAAFKAGSNNPNFLAHPYTCNGTSVPAQTASCNPYMLLKQIKNGQVTTVSSWVDGAFLYHPPKG